LAEFCIPWKLKAWSGDGNFGNRQSKVFEKRCKLATKFGLVSEDKMTTISLKGDPEWVRIACDGSLKRLDVDYIDLYYLHHVDRKVPIEITVSFQPYPLSVHMMLSGI
jgi:aryl-alcohol dehydrogenase-like predicted oxidoreductase